MKLNLKLATSAASRHPIPTVAILLFAVGLTVLAALAVGVGADRTILVDARTRAVSLDFMGDSNAWPIGGAAVCVPRVTPDPFLARGNGACDLRLFEEAEVATGFVEWGPLGRTEVSLNPEGDLVIRVICAASHETGTRIILPAEEWRRNGAFGWIGSVAIGRQAGSGETGLLLDGSYEAREMLRRLPAGMRTTEVVKRGALRSGESVRLVARADAAEEDRRFVENGGAGECPAAATGATANDARETADAAGYRPAVTFGHLVPEADTAWGFHVVALTAPGDTALLVDFAGADRPALVRPNWIDRITASPLVTALATVLAISAALVNVAAGLGSSKKDPPGKSADPDGEEMPPGEPHAQDDVALGESASGGAPSAAVAPASAAITGRS